MPLPLRTPPPPATLRPDRAIAPRVFARAVEDEDEEDEEGRPKPKPVRFNEAHRLAYLVNDIDAEVSVVPRGAYVATATHYVIRNAAYEGSFCLPLACGSEVLDGWWPHSYSCRRRTLPG